MTIQDQAITSVLMRSNDAGDDTKYKYYLRGIYVHGHLQFQMGFDVPHGFSSKHTEEGKYPVQVLKNTDSDPISAMMYVWKSGDDQVCVDRGLIVLESDTNGIAYAEMLLQESPKYM